MEVDDTPEANHPGDLHWHALNYRTATTPQQVKDAFTKLEEYVQRLIQQCRADEAENCRDWYERNYDRRD